MFRDGSVAAVIKNEHDDEVTPTRLRSNLDVFKGIVTQNKNESFSEIEE